MHPCGSEQQKEVYYTANEGFLQTPGLKHRNFLRLGSDCSLSITVQQPPIFPSYNQEDLTELQASSKYKGNDTECFFF